MSRLLKALEQLENKPTPKKSPPASKSPEKKTKQPPPQAPRPKAPQVKKLETAALAAPSEPTSPIVQPPLPANTALAPKRDSIAPQKRNASPAKAVAGPKQAPHPPTEQQAPIEANSQLGSSLSFLQAIHKNLDHPLLGEQYRILARNIASQCEAQKSSAIAFTATESDPHVCETMAHVGLLLAGRQAGEVLLLDGDFPERFLSRHFQASDRHGAANLLSGVQAWQDLIMGSSVKNLFFMPAGSGAANGANSHSALMGDLFYELRKRFRYILVAASSPTHPFSRLMVGACQGAYLIVSMGETNSFKAARSVEQLQLSGVRILGCIATNAPER